MSGKCIAENAKAYLYRLFLESTALLSLIAHIATGKRNISHKCAFHTRSTQQNNENTLKFNEEECKAKKKHTKKQQQQNDENIFYK